MIAIISAVDKNNGIGYKNGLLYTIKEDLELFRKLTKDNVVVMGRNTWLSLPERYRPLPHRVNYVISDIGMDLPDDVGLLGNVNEIADLPAKHPGKTIFVIGGASIYRQTIDVVDALFITHIDLEAEFVDTYFPAIDSDVWGEVNATAITDYATCVEYRKIIDHVMKD
ncbi:MAG: dihydrofolate reductase [Cetobacterium sp.]|uniref:dihydrofolate reductase n=1 Tax=Cetobacterium sp. TaxID=2071632 RepID=UPI003F301B84